MCTILPSSQKRSQFETLSFNSTNTSQTITSWRGPRRMNLIPIFLKQRQLSTNEGPRINKPVCGQAGTGAQTPSSRVPPTALGVIILFQKLKNQYTALKSSSRISIWILWVFFLNLLQGGALTDLFPMNSTDKSAGSYRSRQVQYLLHLVVIFWWHHWPWTRENLSKSSWELQHQLPDESAWTLWRKEQQTSVITWSRAVPSSFLFCGCHSGHVAGYVSGATRV